MLRGVIAVLFWLIPGVAFAPFVVSGGSTTYAPSQAGGYVLRFNSSNLMRDTLPGGGAVLAADSVITVYNDDPKGLLEVKASGGAKLDGATTNFVLLGPKQTASFLSDGTDYRTVKRESRARVATTPFPPMPLPGALIPAYPTFYVDPAGSDLNSGIDATTPFQTIQAAYDFVYRFVDLNGGGVRIKLADGTYTQGLVCSFSLPGFNTRGVPFTVLDGNVSNPAAVHISPTVPNYWDGPDAILVSSSCYLYLQGLKLSAPNGGSALKAVFWGFATLWEGVQFGTVTSSHMRVETNGYVNAAFAYTISGGGASHISVASSGHMLKNAPMSTVAGGASFSNAVIEVNNGLVEFTGGWSGGAVTGVKAKVTKNGILDTSGGGSPGSIASPAPTFGGQIF